MGLLMLRLLFGGGSGSGRSGRSGGGFSGGGGRSGGGGSSRSFWDNAYKKEVYLVQVLFA